MYQPKDIMPFIFRLFHNAYYILGTKRQRGKESRIQKIKENMIWGDGGYYYEIL